MRSRVRLRPDTLYGMFSPPNPLGWAKAEHTSVRLVFPLTQQFQYTMPDLNIYIVKVSVGAFHESSIRWYLPERIDVALKNGSSNSQHAFHA
jgi:hypothetical protein